MLAPTRPRPQLHGHVHAYERTYPMAYYQRVEDGPMVGGSAVRRQRGGPRVWDELGQLQGWAGPLSSSLGTPYAGRVCSFLP